MSSYSNPVKLAAIFLSPQIKWLPMYSVSRFSLACQSLNTQEVWLYSYAMFVQTLTIHWLHQSNCRRRVNCEHNVCILIAKCTLCNLIGATGGSRQPEKRCTSGTRHSFHGAKGLARQAYNYLFGMKWQSVACYPLINSSPPR